MDRSHLRIHARLEQVLWSDFLEQRPVTMWRDVVVYFHRGLPLFVSLILFRQNTNLFAFAFGSFASWTKPKILSFGKIRMGALCPRLSVSLQKIGCGSAICACKPARFLSSFPIFDIVLDRMRLGKLGTSSRFLSAFTIFAEDRIRFSNLCVQARTIALTFHYL